MVQQWLPQLNQESVGLFFRVVLLWVRWHHWVWSGKAGLSLKHFALSACIWPRQSTSRAHLRLKAFVCVSLRLDWHRVITHWHCDDLNLNSRVRNNCLQVCNWPFGNAPRHGTLMSAAAFPSEDLQTIGVFSPLERNQYVSQCAV